MKPHLAVALLHFPVKDRQGRVVATNITHFDIHDIARACRTYGVDQYYIVHPNREQLMYVARILDHWRLQEGAWINPTRRVSLEPVALVSSWEKACAHWQSLQTEQIWRLGTHAREVSGVPVVSCQQVKQALGSRRPVILAFGTGWGLTDEFLTQLDGLLESIRSPWVPDFNHLSVRSAVSIYLDRLMGS